MSLDSVKRSVPHWSSLSDLFRRRYGGVHSRAFYRARRNFVQSAAAYSVVCYLLQIKDRHNGNILLHADGSLAPPHGLAVPRRAPAMACSGPPRPPAGLSRGPRPAPVLGPPRRGPERGAAPCAAPLPAGRSEAAAAPSPRPNGANLAPISRRSRADLAPISCRSRRGWLCHAGAH